MLTWISAACLGLLAPTARADYLLTDSHGQPCGYEALVTAAAAAEVVLFGELHDSAVVHHLQLQFARDLHTARGGRLDLGLEMLETDTQLVLDEFLAGLIRPQDLQSEAKVWKNHATDYQPLLDWARETGLRVTASNVPRRYAALVAREGLAALERLSPAARRWLPPLPIAFDPALPGYRDIMAMAGHGGVKPENLAAAQALKDAAMANSILRSRRPEAGFLHLNGSYHSQRGEGIVWYLRREVPHLRILTIATVAQGELGSLEAASHGLADFVLVVPEPPEAGR